MSKRTYLTPDQKVAIVRRHLLEHVPISDLCDEYGIHATQYYTWQKQLFGTGAVDGSALSELESSARR
jgi:transposase-like protein